MTRIITVFALLSVLPTIGSVGGAFVSLYQFPNPQTNATKCLTKTPSLLCDPERVLSEEERDALHERVERLRRATANADAVDACQRAGVSVGIALTRQEIQANIHFQGTAAEFLHHQWALDRKCQKSAVIVFSNVTKRYTFHTYPAFSVTNAELANILALQRNVFAEGKTHRAFLHILDNIGAVVRQRNALYRHASTTVDDGNEHAGDDIGYGTRKSNELLAKIEQTYGFVIVLNALLFVALVSALLLQFYVYRISRQDATRDERASGFYATNAVDDDALELTPANGAAGK